jgi:glycosyltransferase involved in cell wall biosynthesis
VKISTVITLYNLEKYIDDALQSVFTQTRQSDEIIVVDDCSTDGSADIVTKYRDRVIYIKQEKNIGALRNSLSGLKAATGDIVAFLDGDDVWMPQKLEAIEKEFLYEDVVLVSHDFIRVDENLQDLRILDETNLNTRRITKSYAKRDWSEKLREAILLRKGFWLGSAYAVRKKAILLERFERVIAQHPAAAHLSYLDMTLAPFLVASNPNFKVGFVNEVLFKHRWHGNNSRSSFSSISLEKALSTVVMCQSVDVTTYHLIADFFTDRKIEKRYRVLHGELELLRLQYTGKKVKAIGKFISLSPHLFREGTIAHEFVRLVATTFLGAEVFIRWNTKRKANRAIEPNG